MGIRIGRQALSLASRRSLRSTVSIGNAHIIARRLMSSNSSHTGKPSSDTPWIIGSIVIFGPALAYLLSPYSKKPAHHGDHETHGISEAHSTRTPVHNDHEPETPAAAEEEDSPKDDQSPSSDAALLTDDEGTKISAEELNASMEQAFNADSPKYAQLADENDSKSNTSSPGQASSPGDAEQNQAQETGSLKSGTFKEDGGPTNVGDARKAARDKTSPKEAEEKS